jgi:outer membrane protein
MRTYKYFLVVSGLLALVASPALAGEPATWILRAGFGTVQPESKNLSFTDGTDTVQIDVRNASNMTLGATYMINANWAVDLLGSLPFDHDIRATINGDSGKIGKASELPPTLSIQYHFNSNANFSPYVGLGVNWTTFFDEKLVSAMVDQGVDTLKLKDSYGGAAQVGADWMINDNWLVNLDVRYANIETKAMVNGPDFDGLTNIGTIKINPFVYALNLGYRF